MVDQLTFIFSILSVFTISVTGVLIWRSPLPTTMRPVVYMFLVALISFLLLDQAPTDWAFEVIVTLTFVLPYGIWQLSRAIFSDETLPPLKLFGYAIPIIIWYHACAINFDVEGISAYVTTIMRLTTIGFLVLSVIESQKGKKDDLIRSRIKLRKFFIYFIAITGVITVLTETGLGSTDMLTLKMIQRGAILTFATYFLIVNSKWQDAFFARRPQPVVLKNQGMIDRINQVMTGQQYFKQEGLTIGQLAEKLGEQEYKLRTVINQEMGYRNFPAFVNSFRIEEAKALLTDQSAAALTIQEIAYEVGFSSIGPFNRAFKAATDQTPKEFRDKKSMADL